MKRRTMGANKSDQWQRRLIGLLVALLLAFPTAFILWFFTQTQLALWGVEQGFLGTTGFWLILGTMALLAVVFPGLFPSILSTIWRALIGMGRWF